MCGIDQMDAIEHCRKQKIQDQVISGLVIVDENSDNVVSYAAMNDHFFNCGLIAMLVVDKECRRMGIATALRCLNGVESVTVNETSATIGQDGGSGSTSGSGGSNSGGSGGGGSFALAGLAALGAGLVARRRELSKE